MAVEHVHYLLVGGGAAASACAEAIRRADTTGSLMLVSQEVHRPYDRYRLSKLLFPPRTDFAQSISRDEQWLGKFGITLKSGRRAVALDADRKQVSLDDGTRIVGDFVLLATGAAAMKLGVPGAELPGITNLRTLDDTKRLRQMIDACRSEAAGRAPGVVVVGGGLLGVEVACSLRKDGCEVQLVCRGEYPLAGLCSRFTGECVAGRLVAAGVQVHVQDPVVAFAGDGRVRRVMLQSGKELACDMAVCATGTTAALDIIRGSSLSAERALLTTDRCQTSKAGIYAAGDCSAVYDARFGKHIRCDHWLTATETGRIAGTNMAGGLAKYDAVKRYTLDVLGLSLEFFGEAKMVSRRGMLCADGSWTAIVNDAKTEALRSEAPLSHAWAEGGVSADGRVAQIVSVGSYPGAWEAMVRQRTEIRAG